MNRRDFFKTLATLSATAALTPAIVLADADKAVAQPQLREKTKEWWKAYFRKETVEWDSQNIQDMKRLYTEGAYKQLKELHTDAQIDKLPDSGSGLVFRLHFHKTSGLPLDSGIPTIRIELVKTAIEIVP